MRYVIIALSRYVIIALSMCALLACQGDSGASADLVLTNVTVIDVEDSRLLPDRTIFIAGGRITEVVPSSQASIPPLGTVQSSLQSKSRDPLIIDGAGKYVMPGLWDMHLHLNGRATFTAAELTALVARGITGIRDMGGPLEAINKWRAKSDGGQLLAPRIVAAAGFILDGPRQVTGNRLILSDIRAAADAVQSVLANRADFVKVHDWLSPETYLAVAAEAKRRQVPVVGHVPVAVSAKAASDAGQRSFEHLGNIYGGLLLDCSSREVELRQELLRRQRVAGQSPGVYATSAGFISELLDTFDPGKADALFRQLVQNQTWQVPTLTLLLARENSRRQTGTPNDREQRSRLFAKQLELVGSMRQVGVEFMAGTDRDPRTGPTVHDELQLLVEAGFSPAEALRAATLDPARFLGMEQSAGTIEAGKFADLLVLVDNPLQEVANTQRIHAVIRSGRLISRAEIQQLLEQSKREDGP